MAFSAIKWKVKNDAVVGDCHHNLHLLSQNEKESPYFFVFFLGRLPLLPGSHLLMESSIFHYNRPPVQST